MNSASDDVTGLETAVAVRRRKAARAAFVGTAMEWYDYYLFGTAASLVFSSLYFSSLTPVAATLASLATGGDVVEVSPPYDMTGNTALLAANLLYEMLCVLPGVKSN